MTVRRRLILVSNRGPVGFSRNEAGELVEKRGAGGLVTALRPIVAQHDVTWIASALSEEDRGSRRGGRSSSTARRGRRTASGSSPTTASAYDLYYNVVAEPGALVRAARSRRDAAEPARRAARGVGAGLRRR